MSKSITELSKPSLLNNSELFADINIVICDSDHATAVMVKKILSTLGCNRIFVVHDGQSVLDLMKEEKIDLIVTEWQTRTLSGIDMTMFLRQSLDSVNRMIPIVMLTARNSRKDIQTARDAGVTEYVVKPFSAKTLLERLYEVVQEPRGFVISKTFIGPDRRRVSSFSLPPDPDENHHFFERKPPMIVSKDVLQQLILDDTPRMIMPDYTLKKKVGFDIPDELMIDPLALAKSEEEVQKAQNEFLLTMMRDVESLNGAYADLIKYPEHYRKLIKNIEDACFSIKSRAGIFGYVRATEVATQLHNFCKRYYDSANPHHVIILEKHIQAIGAIFTYKITGDGGEVGRELIIDLARLINKYLNRKE